MAELVERARQQRLEDELIPALRADLLSSLRGLGADVVACARASELIRAAESTTTLDELRVLSTTVLTDTGPAHDRSANAAVIDPESARLASDTFPAPVLLPAGRREPGRGTDPDVGLAGVDFDARLQLLELASIERTASGLGIGLRDLGLARWKAAALAEQIAAGDRRAATSALLELRAANNLLDEQLCETLAAAECRSRTVTAVVSTLQRMGFAPSSPLEVDGQTTILADSVDGRSARIEVTGSGDDVAVHSAFTDSAHALPADDRHCTDVCEPAVLDQYDFQRRMQRVPGISAGRVMADGPPLRGVLPARSASAMPPPQGVQFRQRRS